ncbi:MAG: helix-turn-helix domain-containing protein [Bacteroidota bacterium]
METGIVQQLELLLGSIGVILGVFFSVILLGNRKQQPIYNIFLGIYLVAFSLRIGKSIFHYFYDLNPSLRNFFLAILFCVGPSLWLYSSYLVQKKENFYRKDLAHYGVFFLLLPICWFIPNNGPEEYSIWFVFFYNSIIVHMAGYGLFSFFWFLKNKEKSSKKETDIVNKWLTCFLGLNIIFVVAYALVSKVAFPFYIGLSFLFSFMIVFLAIWALKNPMVFNKSIRKYRLSNIDEQATRKTMDLIKNHFESEKPYLNPNLTLTLLSKQLNISAKELSQTINQQENLNYSQFILKYRIEEAKRLLLSDTHEKFNIASIAYDSGFNSISSFNTAFKKQTDTTPLAFQKNSKKAQ